MAVYKKSSHFHHWSYSLILKSKQQVEPQQFLVHNQDLNIVARVKLNKSYPRAPKGPFTNSEYFQEWQSSLLTSDRKQPMSSKSSLLIQLILTAIVGSIFFIWGLGSRLAQRSIPLACFLDNCRIYSPPRHTCNIVSGVSTFQCVVLCSLLQNDWNRYKNGMIWSHIDPL